MERKERNYWKEIGWFSYEWNDENRKEIKENKYTEEYEEINYEEYIVNKEEWKRNQDDERRSQIVEGKLTQNEMVMIEKEIGRFVDEKFSWIFRRIWMIKFRIKVNVFPKPKPC